MSNNDLNRMGSSDLFTLYECGEITLEQLERWNDGLVEVSQEIQAKRRYNAKYKSSMKRTRIMAVSFAVISPLLGPGAVMGAAMTLGISFMGTALASEE